jgi:uncharacterized membrane protein
MDRRKRIVHSAIAAFLTLAAANTAMAAKNDMAAPDNMEKCYGIVKAGMNDCATATESCAGSAKKDKQTDAFLFLPKGLCAKIAGGMLEDKK